MKKTLTLLLLFLFVVAGAVYLTTQKDTKTTVLTEERNFAVDNIDEVHKIFLADRDGNQVTLKRKNDDWQLNERYRANPNAVQNLLNTLEKVKIKYVPPRAALQNIVRDIATNNIKVEVYNADNQKIKAYYVGGVTNDELGTHMIMEDAEEPFVTYIPGFEGALRVRYATKELAWRDKAIFREKINQIESVSVEYPKQKNKSFSIQKENGQFTVKPFYDTTPTFDKVAPRGKIEQYLTNYERLIAENFANTVEKRDSFEQLLPFSIVRLQRTGEAQKVVKFHPIIKQNDTGSIMVDDAGKAIIEKYYAERGEDFLLVQQLVFGKIFWGYESFFE
ncbi:MAG: hypothetical protein AAF960_00755 [Bacteroidota bacterium]